MSKIDPADDRLARLLDTPGLARVVPHLPPETLHQLIRRRGLEACGELIASATPAQLTLLLDLDLWRHARPGRDHVFDVERFGEWLDVLVETGPALAARTVAGLDKGLVVAGLSRYVRVFDLGIFEPTAQSDDEPPDRHAAMQEGDAIHAGAAAAHDPATAVECEIGGYVVRARRGDAWDAIVTLLIALDAEYGDDFHAVMQGCRSLSNSRSEIDGLDDLLMAPEQHLHDVTIERERRQSQQGYATPADARAFLQMARQPKATHADGSTMPATAVNPIVTAYFRAADDVPEPSIAPARAAGSTPLPPAESRADGGGALHDVAESLEAVIALLVEAGVMPERPRGLLETAAAEGEPQAARLECLRRLMSRVRDTDAGTYFTRSRELAFLANTLLAGCSVQSRPFTPQEASDAAAGICNLGLEYWPARWAGAAGLAGTRTPDSWLIDHDLVSAFEVGWSVLHHDVGLFAAEQLVATLSAIDCLDRDVQHGLVALRRTLVTQRAAGTPWLAREAAEVLGMLDMTAWVGVLGLLDECPVVPAALTAVLDGAAARVSPTAFAFISTAAQIADVRRFLAKLPDVLSR